MADEKPIETTDVPKEEHPVVDMTDAVESKSAAKIRTKRKPYKPRQTKIHGGYVEEAKKAAAPIKYCMNETTLAFTSAVLVVVLVSAYFIGNYVGIMNSQTGINAGVLSAAQATELNGNLTASLQNVTEQRDTCAANLVAYNQMAFQKLCQPLSDKNGTYTTLVAACSETENATWARVR